MPGVLAEQDAVTLLKAHTGIVSRLGGAPTIDQRIVTGRPPINTVYPLIIVRATGVRHTVTSKGTNPQAIAGLTELISVIVIDRDYQNAREIEWMVREALEAEETDNTGPWLLDGDITIDDEDDVDGGNNSFIDIITLNWKVLRKNIPTFT